MNNPKPFSELLSAVQTEITTLRSTIAADTPADIEALAPKLKALIEALPTLTAEDGQHYKAALETLWQDMGELSADFGRIKSAAMQELQTINTRLKAATAYAQSSASEDR
jgi:hypothetical protein